METYQSLLEELKSLFSQEWHELERWIRPYLSTSKLPKLAAKIARKEKGYGIPPLWVRQLFEQEWYGFLKLIKPYFLIIKKGGILLGKIRQTKDFKKIYWIDDEEIPEVETLLKKKVIGIVKRILGYKEDFLFFDDLDAKFNGAIKHPMGIEAYYELRYKAGYSEEDVQILLGKVLERCDKLQKASRRRRRRRKILATAMALTCPRNISRYIKLAGGPSAVNAMGEKIGEGLRYDADARVKAYIPKLEFEDATRKIFLFIRERKGGEGVTGAYIGGLAYFAEQQAYRAGLIKSSKRQLDIARLVGASESGIRINAKKIYTQVKKAWEEDESFREEYVKLIRSLGGKKVTGIYHRK